MGGSKVDLTYIISLYFFHAGSRITSPPKNKREGPHFHEKAVLWRSDILGHGIVALIWAQCLWLPFRLGDSSALSTPLLHVFKEGQP